MQHLRDVEPLSYENTTHLRIVYYPVEILLMLVLLITAIRVSGCSDFIDYIEMREMSARVLS